MHPVLHNNNNCVDDAGDDSDNVSPSTCGRKVGYHGPPLISALCRSYQTFIFNVYPPSPWCRLSKWLLVFPSSSTPPPSLQSHPLHFFLSYDVPKIVFLHFVQKLRFLFRSDLVRLCSRHGKSSLSNTPRMLPVGVRENDADNFNF